MDTAAPVRFETVVDCATASDRFDDPAWAFVDCRFVMRELDRGEREYTQAHISGAVYAHLDRDLSGEIVAGRTGRHPLPLQAALVRTLSAWGIGENTQVVAYDESNGSMAAARLWWLLKWAGHDAAAVLDGGWKKWCSQGLSYSTGAETRGAAEFRPAFRPHMVVDAQELLVVLKDPSCVVLDSRMAERYEGRNETMDPVAGHIAGARSAPYSSSLSEAGTFKTPQELEVLFSAATGGRDAAHTVFYCGSGVTAAHSLLASAFAGRGVPRLYPGSWSEWIIDPSHPIEKR